MTYTNQQKRILLIMSSVDPIFRNVEGQKVRSKKKEQETLS